MKRVFKIISGCFISIFIIFVLGLLIISFMSNDYGVSKFGRYSFLDVNGSSMEPLIKDGDYIAIDKNKKEKYEIGDVISFITIIDSEEKIVTHEIVDVYEDKYVTKGVNNPNIDDKMVSASEIIGVYRGFRIPLLGYVIRFSRTSLGYWLLVIGPLGVMFCITLYEFIKMISEKKEEL